MKKTVKQIGLNIQVWIPRIFFLIISVAAMFFACMYYEQIHQFGKDLPFYSKTPFSLFLGILLFPIAVFFSSIASIFNNDCELNAVRDFSIFFALCSSIGALIFLFLFPILYLLSYWTPYWKRCPLGAPFYFIPPLSPLPQILKNQLFFLYFYQKEP